MYIVHMKFVAFSGLFAEKHLPNIAISISSANFWTFSKGRLRSLHFSTFSHSESRSPFTTVDLERKGKSEIK